MKALLNIFLLVFPLLVFANGNNSDSLGIINGNVFTADGQAAAYVTVQIKNTTKGTNTDANGKFEFKKIKTGKYIVSVSLSGYASTENLCICNLNRHHCNHRKLNKKELFPAYLIQELYVYAIRKIKTFYP
jgi:hypothetical protein